MTLEENDLSATNSEKNNFSETFIKILMTALENATLSEQQKIYSLTGIKSFCRYQLANYLTPAFKQAELQKIEYMLNSMSSFQASISAASKIVLTSPTASRSTPSPSSAKENIAEFTGSPYNYLTSLLSQANAAKKNNEIELEKSLLLQAELIHKQSATLNSSKSGMLENLANVSWNLMIIHLEQADNTNESSKYLNILKAACEYCLQSKASYQQAVDAQKDPSKRLRLFELNQSAHNMLHIIEKTIERETTQTQLQIKKIKI